MSTHPNILIGGYEEAHTFLAAYPVIQHIISIGARHPSAPRISRA